MSEKELGGRRGHKHGTRGKTCVRAKPNQQSSYGRANDQAGKA